MNKPKQFDEQSQATFWSNVSSTASHEIEVTSEKVKILAEKGVVFFIVLGITLVIAIVALTVRSSVLISDLYSSYAKLVQAEDQLERIKVIESMIFGLEKEAFARVKYLTSGLGPEHYTELQTALVEWDELFDKNVALFQTITFKAPEYRRYNCNYYQIRSNLEKRSEAIPIRQHRGYDERTMDPWRDSDYYECLFTLLCDIQAQLITKSTGLDYIWQELVSYYFTLRAYVNMIVAINYAHLTRELVLNKGMFRFDKQEDGENLDDAVIVTLLTLEKGCKISNNDVPGCISALNDLNNLVKTFVEIRNATKALELVDNDEYEPTSNVKKVIATMLETKDLFWNSMMEIHHAKTAIALQNMIGEGVKILIAFFILSSLLAQALRHMKGESKRLQKRHEECIWKFDEACKAVYRLLPEPVAKQLAIGTQVQPEFFHASSIMVSDIVGFTSICSKLTAIEVLAMLNRVYTLFDSQTNSNRCYKIETVGDAYIVAAGVPTRESNHAAKVAKLALVLVEMVGTIKLPRTSDRIRIRVGISSGPVIAGVVGVKMLRYCLFGRTVLQANRMEQTSKPLKIQLSQSSFQELTKFGGFSIVQRDDGEIIDQNPTYWLLGQFDSDLNYAMFSNGSGAFLGAKIIA